LSRTPRCSRNVRSCVLRRALSVPSSDHTERNRGRIKPVMESQDVSKNANILTTPAQVKSALSITQGTSLRRIKPETVFERRKEVMCRTTRRVSVANLRSRWRGHMHRASHDAGMRLVRIPIQKRVIEKARKPNILLALLFTRFCKFAARLHGEQSHVLDKHDEN